MRESFHYAIAQSGRYSYFSDTLEPDDKASDELPVILFL